MEGLYKYSYGMFPFSAVTNIQYVVMAEVSDPSKPTRAILVRAVASREEMLKSPTQIVGLQVWIGFQGMVQLYDEEWEEFLQRYDLWLALH
jgi:hypothetical protein